MRAIRTALCATLLLAGTAFADPRPTIVYDSLPTPLSSNVASVGFEATATSEFGDHIHLKGSRRRVQSITVTMSDWASYADYKTDPRYAGNHRTWMHPVTLNIYKAKTLDAFGAPVVKLFSTTRYIEIPWRPAVHRGTTYCCGGCAQGGPCYCSYDLGERDGHGCHGLGSLTGRTRTRGYARDAR